MVPAENGYRVTKKTDGREVRDIDEKLLHLYKPDEVLCNIGEFIPRCGGPRCQYTTAGSDAGIRLYLYQMENIHWIVYEYGLGALILLMKEWKYRMSKMLLLLLL